MSFPTQIQEVHIIATKFSYFQLCAVAHDSGDSGDSGHCSTDLTCWVGCPVHAYMQRM